MILNHKSSKLSELDMRMVLSIPEGGNWKDIPIDIPSKRLEQIRESFKRGEGSRSTYYGRLKRNYPSYTINTYFNRPGNGCHIHYNQDRVLSQREAARLQSFPDTFEFIGSQGSINKQIGNAVPPLFAYQLGSIFKQKGVFVDLFAGAGGLGYGFKLAGWKPIIANDIENQFLETYAKNVHDNVIVGSIENKKIFDELVSICKAAKLKDIPLWILGGPPCQGFSTAGNKRTMKDPRNNLVWTYIDFLKAVEPDGFIFENVTGLLSMQNGTIFKKIKRAFSNALPSISGHVFSMNHYGVPQRRKRIVLIGQKKDLGIVTDLEKKYSTLHSIQPDITVEEAISDLPPLNMGEDGSYKKYITNPKNNYQKYMRNIISPKEYIKNNLLRGK